MNDNKPMFPLSQYIVQGIAETVPNGTHIIQGKGRESANSLQIIFYCLFTWKLATAVYLPEINDFSM